MSHLIETAAFSAAEGAGWTGLGKEIPAEIANDPAKLAEFVGATYKVVMRPLTYDWQGKPVNALNRVARVRDDTGELLEVTSLNRYHTDNRQPIDIFESFRDELNKEALEISHAAVLDGGRKIAVCARLKGMDITLGGNDTTLSYVTGSTGYDAKTGTNYFRTGIRTVCNNTLQYGLSDAQKAGRLVTISASQRFETGALRDLLTDAMDAVTKEAGFYQRLADVKLSDEQARTYFAEILGIDLALLNARNADGRPVISTRSQNQLAALVQAYKKGPGSHLATANDTLYGALNALTYIIDNESQIRDTHKDGNRVARMTSATFGTGAQAKARAVRLANAMLTKVAA